MTSFGGGSAQTQDMPNRLLRFTEETDQDWNIIVSSFTSLCTLSMHQLLVSLDSTVA